jgi:hypothetical protein
MNRGYNEIPYITQNLECTPIYSIAMNPDVVNPWCSEHPDVVNPWCSEHPDVVNPW